MIFHVVGVFIAIISSILAMAMTRTAIIAIVSDPFVIIFVMAGGFVAGHPVPFSALYSNISAVADDRRRLVPTDKRLMELMVMRFGVIG